MTALTALDKEELIQLRDRVDFLEEKIRMLTEMLLPPEIDYSIDFRLTPAEAKILSALIRLGGKTATRQHLMDLIYATSANGDDIPEAKIIDVWVCKLRRKLKPYDVNIQTVWGTGYFITRADAEQILSYKGLTLEDLNKK